MEGSLEKAFSEVLSILSFMEQKYIDMIPKETLKVFNDYKDENYNCNIDFNVSLDKQNLERKTLVILAMLNINYWCENEEEKKKLIEMYSQNDKNKDKIFEQIRENSDINKIFNNDEEDNNDKAIVEYKEEKFFEKILKKIMSFFKKK